MKGVTIAIAIWTWLTLRTSGQDITLVVSKGTTEQAYADFLTRVRNAVKATGTCHGLPMASGPKANPEFVEVKLKTASSRNVIRLGFQRSDLYFEGYADEYKGACRYRVFKDSNTNVKSFLCGTVKQPGGDVNNIYYDKNYGAIEKNAKTERSKFGLGMEKLESRINKIYGKTKSDDNAYVKNEAEFFLLSIQMIAEAARSKYLEDKIKQNIKSEYKPDPRALSLQDFWKKVSELMAAQTDPKGSVTLPKGMKDENDKEWKTETISNLKTKYMALLSYVPTCKVKSPVFYFFKDDPSSMMTM